jgi:SAM-dependent methyltransferase
MAIGPRAGQDPHALLRAGHVEEAVLLYRRAAEAHPRRPEAHNNLAVALKAAGRTKEAVQAYRRALKLDPTYETARSNLARALREIGDIEEALSHFARLLRTRPDDITLRSEISETLIVAEFPKPSITARQLLLDLFRRRDMDLQRLSQPAVRLLMTNRRLAGAIAVALEAYPDGEPKRPIVTRDLVDPLLIAVLTWTIPPSREVEIWITIARKALLASVIASRPTGIDRDLLWAMAAHCHATEHAAFSTADERAAAEALAVRVEPGDESGIAVAGLYLPLSRIPAARALLDRVSALPEDASAMRLLLERAVAHPEAEQAIASDLRVLTPVEDGTSRAVRAQYEANPYPKWLSIDRPREPLALGDRLKRRYPVTEAAGLDLARPRILVAGCGTGRHAITTAARYKDSTVLAVDISTASLAYAGRQARSFGQTNISFAQADILGLESLQERFDLIECSGVLHHMADPVAGWRVLRGLLKPQGLMRIGLYSERARKRWEPLREPIDGHTQPGEAADMLRNRRGALLAQPPDGPEAVVLRIADFYSLSGCRDLLFHASEAGFSPRAIDLLGFDTLAEETMKAFRSRFPAPGAERDLAAWDTFEIDNPDTFIAMYQFWCQARN